MVFYRDTTRDLALGHATNLRSYCSCYDNGSYSSGGYCYSSWDSYGRWIVVAAVIAGGFFIFFAFAYATNLVFLEFSINNSTDALLLVDVAVPV